MIAMQELFTTEDVARILRISEYTAREMCKRGEIKSKKIGRNWRVKQEDLQSYIDREESEEDKK
jgi:putative molybdopterin biosynthesis protein